MSIRVAQKLYILTPLQKLPKNVGDLGKLIVAKGFKNLSKVTLVTRHKIKFCQMALLVIVKLRLWT